MTEDPHERTHDRPLHGERRKQWPALLGVLALVVVIAGVFALITLLRYTT